MTATIYMAEKQGETENTEFSLERGMERFGDWLVRSRTSKDTLKRYNEWATQNNEEEEDDEVDRKQLERWFYGMEWRWPKVKINSDLLFRLENKTLRKEPRVAVLWIFAESQIFKVKAVDPGSGKVYERPATCEELMKTTIGKLDPTKIIE